MVNTVFVICIDFDECGAQTDACDQNCHNTIGSYTCSCNTGYILDSDRTSCDGTYIVQIQKKVTHRVFLYASIDINECNSTTANGCQQICINNPGSYSCSCNSGFSLNSDGLTCSGKSRSGVEYYIV